MDWNCVKKKKKDLKNVQKQDGHIFSDMTSCNSPTIVFRKADISSADQRLHPEARCPASAGSVCWELQRGTETFLCSCSHHGYWEKIKQTMTGCSCELNFILQGETSTLLIFTTYPAIPPRAMWLWPGIAPSRPGNEKPNIRSAAQPHKLKH